ncbi:Flp family type IVb pilin [Pragia fontium]|uniref:Pilus assembly protein Flp/PilA n=2 Tax=Pragia fontium TaxID=82985 RepID=A0AAJ4W8A8_9GAMM|nr:Flp family type IVb pilin [Pragia fontium]GKX63302.1 pilus assembly protein PilA [Pragia fontium]SFC13872.1 pilus assembly protein Flp/PilA [Pragia fontium DSM 5563 = ATCC 49100]SUB81317.1 Flp pilus assembly protein, pilin Flp [Pragia fontium]VEJ53488.1 Flp pilus assembly protein, pilin Flp [Pragia fontium]
MFNMMTKGYVAASLRIESFLKNQRGITAIEYALIGVAMASLLAVVLGTGDGSGFLYELKQTFLKISQSIKAVTVGSTK